MSPLGLKRTMTARFVYAEAGPCARPMTAFSSAALGTASKAISKEPVSAVMGWLDQVAEEVSGSSDPSASCRDALHANQERQPSTTMQARVREAWAFMPPESAHFSPCASLSEAVATSGNVASDLIAV